MQGWITEEIKKIKLQICTVCLGWSKLDKALVFGDVGDGGEGIAYIYIYMWQGPFGIMRPSSLSPHIVLLFFLWLLSLSLSFSFCFSFFLSLSLSLSFLLFFSLRAFLGIRFSSSPICVPTCLPCSLQFVSLIPSPLLFFSFLLLGCFLYLSLNCCPRLCALWDETYCPLHSLILGLCFLLSFLFPFFPYLFIYSFPVLSSPSLQLLSLGAVRTQDSPCLPCVPICVLIQPISLPFLTPFYFPTHSTLSVAVSV